MRIFTVAKQFRFSYGHRLTKHAGDCKFIHGHNGLLEVRVKGTVQEETGMVIDFSDLKAMVQPIVDLLDHSMIINAKEDVELLEFLQKAEWEHFTMQCEPTAEKLVTWIAQMLRQDILKSGYGNIKEVTVKLFETDDSWAELTRTIGRTEI